MGHKHYTTVILLVPRIKIELLVSLVDVSLLLSNNVASAFHYLITNEVYFPTLRHTYDQLNYGAKSFLKSLVLCTVEQ